MGAALPRVALGVATDVVPIQVERHQGRLAQVLVQDACRRVLHDIDRPTGKAATGVPHAIASRSTRRRYRCGWERRTRPSAGRSPPARSGPGAHEDRLREPPLQGGRAGPSPTTNFVPGRSKGRGWRPDPLAEPPHAAPGAAQEEFRGTSAWDGPEALGGEHVHVVPQRSRHAIVFLSVTTTPLICGAQASVTSSRRMLFLPRNGHRPSLGRLDDPPVDEPKFAASSSTRAVRLSTQSPSLQ